MAAKDEDVKTLPKLCRTCEARPGGICGALTPEELSKLAKNSRRKSLEPGRALASQSEQVNSFSNILRGAVKLSKTLSDGRQQIVGLQFAPDFVGRPFRENSELNAEASVPTDVCTFPTSAIEQLMSTSPDLTKRLHRQALIELDDARDWMLTLGRKNAREKVASLLFKIAMQIDPERPSQTFILPLTRIEIADFLGLTIETVSRQFTRLRAARVIRVEANRIVHVLNMEALKIEASVD